MTTNQKPPHGSDSAAIWQGYHHTWEYNHRLNRLGSYVRRARTGADAAPAPSADLAPGPGPIVVGHTAASGTGNDTAHFTEFVTEVRAAKGVAFQAGAASATAECQRGDLTPFIIRIEDLPLAPELQGRDTYTVVLNGFDIYALEHSEKLMTLDLEVAEPQITEAGTRARFRILGDLRFDCRSPECQLLPLRLEVERIGEDGWDETDDSVPPEPMIPEPRPKRGLDRRRFDRVARWLKRQLGQMTDVEEIKRSVVDDTGDTTRRRLFRILGRRFYLRFLKWRLSAPYVIRVHYLIIAADREALTVTESADFEHGYSWDMEHEIRYGAVGSLPVQVVGDDPARYAVNTLAFRRILVDVRFDETQGSDDPVQWGLGMHMLAWHMAIREIGTQASGLGQRPATATLDLFYQNWSEEMNEVITLTTWGAVRAAGHARMAARLMLLQFRDAEGGEQQALPGRIYWPGAGRSAVRDPQARFERVLERTAAREEVVICPES